MIKIQVIPFQKYVLLNDFFSDAKKKIKSLIIFLILIIKIFSTTSTIIILFNYPTHNFIYFNFFLIFFLGGRFFRFSLCILRKTPQS
jgi:hypothetical protein